MGDHADYLIEQILAGDVYGYDDDAHGGFSPIQCKFCSNLDVFWNVENGKFVLTNNDGTRHHCEQYRIFHRQNHPAKNFLEKLKCGN